PQNFGSVLIPDQKTRRPWKTKVMEMSMLVGTVWTFLGLTGTPWRLVRASRNLFQDQLQLEDNGVLLGAAYFLLMFLPIPFVHGAALFGYWTPRLILPALLCFFLAGFLLVDRQLVTKSRNVAFVLVTLVALQSITEILILI